MSTTGSCSVYGSEKILICGDKSHGLILSGRSLQKLQELVEWTGLEMVLRYVHLAADYLKSAASRIEGTILEQSEQEQKPRRVVGN